MKNLGKLLPIKDKVDEEYDVLVIYPETTEEYDVLVLYPEKEDLEKEPIIEVEEPNVKEITKKKEISSKDLNKLTKIIEEKKIKKGDVSTSKDRYLPLRDKLVEGEILVKDKKGNIGAIDADDFDATIYVKI